MLNIFISTKIRTNETPDFKSDYQFSINLEKKIVETFAGEKVTTFLSTPEKNPPGDKYWQNITKFLSTTNVYVLVLFEVEDLNEISHKPDFAYQTNYLIEEYDYFNSKEKNTTKNKIFIPVLSTNVSNNIEKINNKAIKGRIRTTKYPKPIDQNNWQTSTDEAITAIINLQLKGLLTKQKKQEDEVEQLRKQKELRNQKNHQTNSNSNLFQTNSNDKPKVKNFNDEQNELKSLASALTYINNVVTSKDKTPSSAIYFSTIFSNIQSVKDATDPNNAITSIQKDDSIKLSWEEWLLKQYKKIKADRDNSAKMTIASQIEKFKSKLVYVIEKYNNLNDRGFSDFSIREKLKEDYKALEGVVQLREELIKWRTEATTWQKIIEQFPQYPVTFHNKKLWFISQKKENINKICKLIRSKNKLVTEEGLIVTIESNLKKGSSIIFSIENFIIRKEKKMLEVFDFVPLLK
jgi:hypothetical protein